MFILPTEKNKKARSPFFKLLCVLYALCFAAAFCLTFYLLIAQNEKPKPDDTDTGAEPTFVFPVKPTVQCTIPDWYPSDSLSPLFTVTEQTDESQLIKACLINFPLPDFATYAEPVNSRYLKLLSENFGGYSYIPDALAYSPTVLMDMKDGRIFGLEETIAASTSLSISKEEIHECIEIIDFQKSDRFCLFRLFDPASACGDEQAATTLPASRIGIFDADNKTIRLLSVLSGTDFTLEAASEDFNHLVIKVSSREGTGNTLWINTVTEKQCDISSLNNRSFSSASCTFSPNGRYILNRLLKNSDEIDFLLVDTATETVTAGKGEVRRFTQNDAALLVWDGRDPMLISLPDGEKTVITDTNDPECYFLQIGNETVSLVSCDGKTVFPLFEKVQYYLFRKELLYFKQTDSPYIFCYNQQNNQAFYVDIQGFLDTAGAHDTKRFDFFVVNGGSNLLLRVSYPTEIPLYPDLESPFIDEAYQLQPIIETVGMEAFSAYENNVYEKYSKSRRNAKPPLYDFILGLKLKREDLPKGAYQDATLDAVFTEDEEEMLIGLASPYALCVNGKVMLYTQVLKMSETAIKTAALPLEVYQSYLKTIHTVFVRYDAPSVANDFLEDCKAFEEKYALSFA